MISSIRQASQKPSAGVSEPRTPAGPGEVGGGARLLSVFRDTGILQSEMVPRTTKLAKKASFRRVPGVCNLLLGYNT